MVMMTDRVAENVNQRNAVSRNFYNLTLTLGTATQMYITIPVEGKVVRVDTVLNGTLTTADEVLTIKNSAAASMGTITLTQSGSAVGDQDSLSPTSNNHIAAGGVVEVETGGQNGTASTATITITVDSYEY